MLARILEPELMDDDREAALYDEMDHSEVNRKFVGDFLESGDIGTDIVDLGTGTARIPIELCQANSSCRVMASDAAIAMLELARFNVSIHGLDFRIQLHHGDSKKLGFADEMFDALISNSLLHHIPDPACVVSEMVRIVKTGGRVFVRDLCRQASEEEIEALVQTYTSGETSESQQLFRQSLAAALTVDEIRSLVARHGFSTDSVQLTSDRHWTWSALKP